LTVELAARHFGLNLASNRLKADYGKYSRDLAHLAYRNNEPRLADRLLQESITNPWQETGCGSPAARVCRIHARER